MNLSRGFTLIELMVTISVAAIVLTVGVPSFRDLTQSNRMATSVNDFVTDLMLGRSEAIKRGQSVTLCKRNTAGTACNSSASWRQGWIVFADGDGDGIIDAGETILRVHAELTGLTALNFSRNRITFNAQGFAQGYNGTLTFCDDRGVSKAKGKFLSSTGRLRDATGSDTLSCS